MENFDVEKEDTFHDSHTNRYSYYNEVISPSISIDRPESIDNGLITKYYSQIDDYFTENNQRIEHSCVCNSNGQKCYRASSHWIGLKISHEEVAEVLEAACTSKSTEYNNWNNTTSVTYSVPSTYEVDVVWQKKLMKPKFSSVDGKLYERDMIYHYSQLSHSWQPICHAKIAVPVFKTATDKIDSKIVPLKISSVTCNDPEAKRKNGSKFSLYRRGILQHDTNWNYAYSLNVAGDVFIDLGQPQIVSHIGTIGSFIPTKWYPEHLNTTTIYSKNRKSRWRRKYSQGIEVEEDKCSQSWCVSYRLMYKKSVSDPYVFIGVYKANQNSYELVVNDLRSNLPSVPIRYLLLKPLSNRPRNFPAYSSCRMCISVYGKAPEVPKNKVWSDDGGDVKNEVQLIRYTLCVPPVKKIRVKQAHGNCHNYCDYGVESKEKTKQRLLREMEEEAYDNFHNCGCIYCFDPNRADDWEDYLWQLYIESLHWDGTDSDCDDYGDEWNTAADIVDNSTPEFDARLDDLNMWPPLPSVATSGVSVVSLEEESSEPRVASEMDSVTDGVSTVDTVISSDSDWEVI